MTTASSSNLGPAGQRRSRVHKGLESEFERRMRESEEAAPTLTRCLFCSWSFDGTALEGQAAALKHRRRRHPGAVASGKRKGPRKPTAARVVKAEPVPSPPPREPWHGTMTGYSGRHKCRCGLCRAANAEYQRRYQARKREAA